MNWVCVKVSIRVLTLVGESWWWEGESECSSEWRHASRSHTRSKTLTIIYYDNKLLVFTVESSVVYWTPYVSTDSANHVCSRLYVICYSISREKKWRAANVIVNDVVTKCCISPICVNNILHVSGFYLFILVKHANHRTRVSERCILVSPVVTMLHIAYNIICFTN